MSEMIPPNKAVEPSKEQSIWGDRTYRKTVSEIFYAN
jgi:hypothetical protein